MEGIGGKSRGSIKNRLDGVLLQKEREVWPSFIVKSTVPECFYNFVAHALLCAGILAEIEEIYVCYLFSGGIGRTFCACRVEYSCTLMSARKRGSVSTSSGT